MDNGVEWVLQHIMMRHGKSGINVLSVWACVLIQQQITHAFTWFPELFCFIIDMVENQCTIFTTPTA